MDKVISPLTTVKPSLKMPVIKTAAIPPNPSHPIHLVDGTWSILKIVACILILTTLGINIMLYSVYGTNYLTKIGEKLLYFIPSGVSKTLHLSEEGTELAEEVAVGVVEDVGKIIAPVKEVKNDVPTPHKDLWDKRDKSLSEAIDKRQVSGINKYPEHEPDQEPDHKPDRTDSSIQSPPSKGWCYVGTDKGFRSCAQIRNSTSCLSGKIFPTKAICINPSLRE